jgi:hypothetical protein
VAVALLVSPIDAKTFDAKTPSNVLKCVPLCVVRMQKKPLGAVFAIVKVLVFLAIFFFRAADIFLKKTHQKRHLQGSRRRDKRPLTFAVCSVSFCCIGSGCLR